MVRIMNTWLKKLKQKTTAIIKGRVSQADAPMDVGATVDAGSQSDKPELFDNPKFQLIISILTVLIISILPMIITWSANASGLDFLEGFFPIMISLFIGAVVFCMTWLATKRNAPMTGLLGAVICFILLGYGAFRSIANTIIPFVTTWLGTLLITTIISGLIIIGIVKARNSKILPRVLFIVFISIALLCVYNGISIIRPAAKRATAYSQYVGFRSPDTMPLLEGSNTVQNKSNKDMPNIYYILLDECGDFYTMEKYYDIKTAENPLYIKLNDLGFNISLESSAHTNRSVYCMANAFSLDYVCTEKTTNRQARIASFTGEWFDKTIELGYDNYQVSSHTAHYLQLKEISDISIIESILSSVTEDGKSVIDILVENSILSMASDIAGLANVTFVDEISASIYKKRLQRVSDYYTNPSNYAYVNPTIIYTYVLPPHTPFFCDENGNTTPIRERCNWVDKKYYKGLYLYMVDYISEIIDNIIINDPESIIVLQSDHGVRGGMFTESSLEIDLYDQCRILNAVYYKGEHFDIAGLSAVNTLRKFLAEAGLDYPPVKDMDYIFWQDQLED